MIDKIGKILGELEIEIEAYLQELETQIDVIVVNYKDYENKDLIKNSIGLIIDSMMADENDLSEDEKIRLINIKNKINEF